MDNHVGILNISQEQVAMHVEGTLVCLIKVCGVPPLFHQSPPPVSTMTLIVIPSLFSFHHLSTKEVLIHMHLLSLLLRGCWELLKKVCILPLLLLNFFNSI